MDVPLKFTHLYTKNLKSCKPWEKERYTTFSPSFQSFWLIKPRKKINFKKKGEKTFLRRYLLLHNFNPRRSHYEKTKIHLQNYLYTIDVTHHVYMFIYMQINLYLEVCVFKLAFLQLCCNYVATCLWLHINSSKIYIYQP